ncbi:hypothetical protein J6590_049778 [Homalodisca vitripennis]|nr:hypothetical protein J6590_049778 [Homalodisca vitripennis]
MLFKDQKQLSEFVENVRKLRRVYSGKVNVTDDSSASWESRLLCSMDGDGEKDEEVDLLEPPCTATTVGSDDEKTDNQTSAKTKFSFKNPFSKKKKLPDWQKSASGAEAQYQWSGLLPLTRGVPQGSVLGPPEDTPAEEEGEEIPIEKRPGFLHAIKLPLVSVLPRKLKSTKEPDLEEGGGSTTPKPAGLASMETLDDSNGSTKHSDDKTDEGLETVKLDSSVEEKAALDTEKNSDEKKVWDRNALMDRLASLKEFRYIIAGVVIFLILLIIIVVIAIAGPRPITASPIINGRYVRAVTSCGEVEGSVLKLQPSNEVTLSLIFRGLDKAGEFPQEDLIGCFRRFNSWCPSRVRKRPLRLKCMTIGNPIEEEEEPHIFH